MPVPVIVCLAVPSSEGRSYLERLGQAFESGSMEDLDLTVAEISSRGEALPGHLLDALIRAQRAGQETRTSWWKRLGLKEIF